MDSVFAPSNTAVITGGASGIGLALATKCCNAGMKVVIVDRNTELLGRAENVLGNGAIPFGMDVSSADDWARLNQLITSDLLGRGPRKQWRGRRTAAHIPWF
jgi:NAD(P)-dependent dehydrogenase (short-subunit alcohol dehydrogenase family)